MPSGRTHDRITLLSLPVVTLLALLLSRSAGLTLVVCAGFLFGGLMLGPDLDTYSVHFKRWGWFRWIWIPYQGSVRHRSPLSHAPITGTVLRVVYLLVWLGLASFAGLTIANELWQLGFTWHGLLDLLQTWLQRYKLQSIALLIGLELGALSHYAADGLLTTYKRIKTKGWKAAFPKRKRRSRSASRRRKS